MAEKDPHKILGVPHGATGRQIKSAYRKLALRYHPDLNQSAGAQEKFHEIHKAYESLLELSEKGEARSEGFDDQVAREIYRRERERMQRQARARQDKKRREDEMFNRPEVHDPILLAKYVMHGLGLLFALAAIIGPVLIAIFVEPASLAGTFFFVVAGIVLLSYIYPRRKTWFRLGKFKTGWRDIRAFFTIGKDRYTRDYCCYSNHSMAGGKPYRLELFKILDVKIQSYGALNHDARYKTRVKRVVIPRSSRAQFFHNLSSTVKLASIAACLLFFPVDSYLWRFLAGLFAGGVISAILLWVARIRPKVAYLFTPGLIIKLGIWILALLLISETGPGFDIRTSGYVYLVVAGLLFLLDMIFDLLMGLFPFYKWMFQPLLKQGKIMDALYKEGYQNYQELPVYSVLYPLFRWLF